MSKLVVLTELIGGLFPNNLIMNIIHRNMNVGNLVNYLFRQNATQFLKVQSFLTFNEIIYFYSTMLDDEYYVNSFLYEMFMHLLYMLFDSFWHEALHSSCHSQYCTSICHTFHDNSNIHSWKNEGIYHSCLCMSIRLIYSYKSSLVFHFINVRHASFIQVRSSKTC